MKPRLHARLVLVAKFLDQDNLYRIERIIWKNDNEAYNDIGGRDL